MCGIGVILGSQVDERLLHRINRVQAHRGPDDEGIWMSPGRECGLAHRRLSILDVSEAGRQPMRDASGRYVIVFNGEIYNYLELQDQLGGVESFRSGSDTEVLLRAYVRWGKDCLDRLMGMFAFAIWDCQERRLFAARDRFGVKPLYIGHTQEGHQVLASEIKTLFAAGISKRLNESVWATYLAQGVYDHTAETFWEGIRQLEAGTWLSWDESKGQQICRWYDLSARVEAMGMDSRPEEKVMSEALALVQDSIAMRFRSDVPVGVCLSGGFDSSLLLQATVAVRDQAAAVDCYTFECNDERYDETPWVKEMVAKTGQESVLCRLMPDEVPSLAAQVAYAQDEPFGGLPTLGMVKVHQRARQRGVVVLLDGNGLDEAWAGYDYYRRAGQAEAQAGRVQGSRSSATRPECLGSDFRQLAKRFEYSPDSADPVRALQVRDLLYTKIPRAMRFADRASMMESRELREPFLDHRLVELGLRQPVSRKISDGQGKFILRRAARRFLPETIREAPKRPVQTPQREWLRESLRFWVDQQIETCLCSEVRGWFNAESVRATWRDYCEGSADNSFWVWQWISLGLLLSQTAPVSNDGANDSL